jgi:hypothetical protein
LGHATALGRPSCTSDSTECIIKPHSYTDLYNYAYSESDWNAYTDCNPHWNSYKYGDSYGYTRTRLNTFKFSYADAYTESYTLH